ncbi:carboxy-terminal processing protease [Formosa agariphila KMM 3901]|uniref:Carboxy-terminal processing protease n=1 Tax=Formosa agariphila (strain DSM 15362 / KCTC 12365 / LMG 23005 / KMM 3901 / M-2Alg 35-1) TaxID=1347342 RepID=T2KHI9_FORAG|nr:S41 family peptidase [Formosa agariphila]CDF77863.1 carboxy-terminal processing protease [Formosa agariphila KMM 3901]
MGIRKTYLPLIIGTAMAVGIFIGGKLNFSDTSDRLFTSNSKKQKLNRLIDYIDYEYVDDVNTDSIVDITVNGILETLDPHSVYIPKEDMERVSENMKGDFVGIGVHFYTYKDTVTVIRTVDDGPSAKAGILGGDRIIFADGDSLFGKYLDNLDIVHRLKGPINSKVHLKVFRKDTNQILDFDVARDVIPIRSVDASYMLTNTLGYIKVNRFAESTYREFKKALLELKAEGATEITLDLRDNPGGFLAVAEQIVDEFLEDEKLILFTKNKRGNIDKSFATEKGDFETGEVYVLINENSASASEIVAGALQDNDKGTIVGRRSYGKGLVQREMELGDGSAVRLTVSRYYTPTGRSIQRSYSDGNKDYYAEYLERLESGELLDSAKIIVADSLKFTTPKGKVVYGGGGIIPDVFVPFSTNEENETLWFLEDRGFINYFIFEELEKDRHVFDGHNREEFVETYEVSDDLVTKFQDYINARMAASISFLSHPAQVKLYLKAAIADQLFGKGAYTEVFINEDDMVKKVIALSEQH